MERQPQNHPLPEGARPPFVLGGRECLWQIIGIAILACVVVGIGVLSLLMPKPETSLIERRELAKRPDFTLENYFSGQWAEEMDLYYADTFPLRDTLVGWGSDLQEAYGLRLRRLTLEPDKMRRILEIGVPAALQFILFSIANLFVQASVNSFDHVMVEGNSAAANADPLIYDMMTAIYTACASFIAQNLGGGKRGRILRSYFICLAYSFGAGMVLGVGIYLFRYPFLSLFTNDAAVVEAAIHRISVMAFSYGISAFMDCTIAAARGLGKTIVPTIIVILGSVVFRIIWIFTIFAHFRTIESLYLLYAFSWGITALPEILYFIHIYRRTLTGPGRQTA